MMPDNPILSFQGISKSFPGVKALDSVEFELRPGEIHALCGENGAGKSTFLKILNGTYADYTGEIFYQGKKIHFSDTSESRKAGISVIPQEIALALDLSVAENIFMGSQTKNKLGFIDWDAMFQETRTLQATLGGAVASLRPQTLCRDLSMGQRQIVEILKAISFDIKVLALDEPTSSLSDEETVQLFQLVRRLRDQGVSIIYISHRLQEIFEVCDRVSVFKDGKSMGTKEISGLAMKDLVSLMVGRGLDMFGAVQGQTSRTNEEVLRVENFTRATAFRDISFQLHRGEILGFFGIIGSGRTEVARAIFGVDPKDAGTLFLAGKPVTIRHPKDAVRHKLAFLTEDRHGQGLVLPETIRTNITLASLKDILNSWGLLSRKKETEVAKEFMSVLKVRAPSHSFTVGNLSGGNQQKVVLAKWLASHADIFIFDEPTRGIDVGTKAEIYLLMRQLAQQGKSILMISSELPEVLALSDRILVFQDGRINATLENEHLTENEVLNYAILTRGNHGQ